jgi:hypothetical protein
MSMDKTILITKDCLLYPLKAGNILILPIMSVIGGFLFLSMNLSLKDYGGGFARMFFVMGLLVFYPFINALFEHGLNIIEASAHGKKEPPVLGYRAIKGSRFFKQVLAMTLLLGFAQYVLITGHPYGAGVILFLVVFMLPASMVSYSVYGNTLSMINPFAILPLAIKLGLPYLLSMVPLVLIAGLVEQMVSTGLLGTIVLMLAALYILMAFYRFLGLCFYQRHATLIKDIGFAEEKNQAVEVDRHSRHFNEVLFRAHELIRAGEVEQAEKLILPVVEVKSWGRFEKVFSITSEWKDKRPALSLIKKYIPVLIERQQFVRALELCHWAVSMSPDFVLDQSETVVTLAREASVKEEYRTAIQLIENVVEANSDLMKLLKLLKDEVSR